LNARNLEAIYIVFRGKFLATPGKYRLKGGNN
jgi:hypothetical protein